MARFLTPHLARVALIRRINRLRGRRNVHLLHIGKTGGTAVQAAVRRSDASQSLIIHPHAITMQHISPGDEVVFFVRDPIKRFVSGFFSRKRQGRPSHNVPWSRAERRAFEQFPTPEMLAIGLEDADERRRALARMAMQSIQHVQSSYWDWFINEQFMASRWDDIVFIGQQESLGADFEALKHVMDWPANLALPKDPRTAHQSPAGENRRLSDEAQDNLARWYVSDYRFLQLCSQRRRDLGQKPFVAEYTAPGGSTIKAP